MSAVLTVRLLIGLGIKVMLRQEPQAVLAANLVLTASNADQALTALISQWTFEQSQLHPQQAW